MTLTTSIALFVYCYSFSYFRNEPYTERLVIFLNLFVISMIIFVSAGNLFLIFFGWELIGLTSFVLINFWVTRVSTLKAAFKAFTFNKISDGCLLLFCIIILNLIGNTSITKVLLVLPLYQNSNVGILFFTVNICEFLVFLLCSAAFIKSAQIGPHI